MFVSNHSYLGYIFLFSFTTAAYRLIVSLPQTNCDRIISYRITTNPLSTKGRLPVTVSSATIVNGDVSIINNGGSTAEGFAFDPEIPSLIHQLWQDLIPKVMDHSREFYL
jgi:guanine nucleotide-binding protein subunit alpha